MMYTSPKFESEEAAEARLNLFKMTSEDSQGRRLVVQDVE